MTQRGNTLPGLAGALSLVLGKDTYQVGNGSFPEEGLPRVALMFLTRGPMPYESVWRTFLDGVPDKQQGEQRKHSWRLNQHQFAALLTSISDLLPNTQRCDCIWGSPSSCPGMNAKIRVIRNLPALACAEDGSQLWQLSARRHQLFKWNFI